MQRVAQERETRREYIESESHVFWGKRYLLSLIEWDARPTIALKLNKIQLTIRPETETARRQEIMEQWYPD